MSSDSKTTITTDEELAVLLGTLGTTPDEVADKLRAAGIKGVKEEGDACPVANWLRAEVAELEDVCADLQYTHVALPGEALMVDTPDPVTLFIERFDDGVYLDLVEGA